MLVTHECCTESKARSDICSWHCKYIQSTHLQIPEQLLPILGLPLLHLPGHRLLMPVFSQELGQLTHSRGYTVYLRGRRLFSLF